MVAEFFAASWVIGQVGFGTTLLLVIALGFLGVAVVRWKAAGLLVSTIESATNSSVETTSAIAGRALGLAAGILIAVPGFVSSAFGLILLLTPVRRLAEPFLAARATSWSVPFINRSGPTASSRRGPSGDGTIIDVDIVDRSHPGGSDTGDAADVPRSARPEIG